MAVATYIGTVTWVVCSKNMLRTKYGTAEMWKVEKSRLKYVRPMSVKQISGLAFDSVHSILKAFKCSQCDRAFEQNSHLNRHIKAVQGICLPKFLNGQAINLTKKSVKLLTSNSISVSYSWNSSLHQFTLISICSLLCIYFLAWNPLHI
jgi:hypothetical protein